MRRRWGLFVVCLVLGIVFPMVVFAQEPEPGADLRSMIEYLFSGGAGVVAFLFIEQILPKIVDIDELASHWKRWLSWVIAAALGCGAVGIGVAMQYVPKPEDLRVLVELLFKAAALAILAAEALHGGFILRGKKS